MIHWIKFIDEINQVKGYSYIAYFEAIARLLMSPLGAISISLIIIIAALIAYLFGFLRYSRPIIRNITEAYSKLNNYDNQQAFVNDYFTTVQFL